MNQPQGYVRFDHFLAAMVNAANGVHDDRLATHRMAVATGLSEGGQDVGGFLIPDGVANEIWSRVYSTGRILRLCDRQPLTRPNGVKIPVVGETSRVNGSRFGGVQMYWTGEAGAAPSASRPALDLANLSLKKLLGLAYVTDELLQDAPALDAFLKRAFTLEATFGIEDKIINGTGAGVPLGVLNSGALITVAAEAAQPAGTVVYENLQKMAVRLWGASHGTAMWLMGNDAWGQVELMQKTLGFDVIELGADGRRYLLEMPIELCEYTPTLGSAGDILLCDFTQYLVAQHDVETASSIHVQFAQDESVFRFRYRVDGQPGWKTPVTPKNSTTTQSPFVALAAR
jgi:HK97 family phage major capsid protein